MLTILAFFLTLLGSLNWLLIGLLQYDFVAGIFGYQGSVFSRLIYIIIGLSCVMLIVKLVKGRGTIAVFSRRNKQDLKKQLDKMGKKDEQPSPQNIEASKEFDELDRQHYGQGEPIGSESDEEKSDGGLLDEHLK